MRKITTPNTPDNRSPMIVNPESGLDRLQSEADMRLTNASDMLSGLAGADSSSLMVSDVQAACGAASQLIEDAILMMEQAIALAKEGGDSR